MTLIVTIIGNLGILQVSDSNLTSRDSAGMDRPYGTGKKVYELGFCPGALALSGSYRIQGAPMDSWMPNAINDFAANAIASPHLEGFAHYLGERMTAEGTPGETRLLIHIAGYPYASDAHRSHPEMWFVRNFKGTDDVTGEYIGLSDTYDATEDFWTRDYPNGGQILRASTGIGTSMGFRTVASTTSTLALGSTPSSRTCGLSPAGNSANHEIFPSSRCSWSWSSAR